MFKKANFAAVNRFFITVKRRFFSILLLFCMFGAPAGLYCYWWHDMEELKKEVSTRFLKSIPKEALVCLRIAEKDAASALRWEDKGELAYQAQLYDVVDSLRSGDTLYYWCWWDKKETALKAQLKSLIADVLEQNLPHRENQKRLQAFFKSLFCATAPDAAWQLPSRRFEQRPPLPKQDRALSLFGASPPAPPPKLV